MSGLPLENPGGVGNGMDPGATAVVDSRLLGLATNERVGDDGTSFRIATVSGRDTNSAYRSSSASNTEANGLMHPQQRTAVASVHYGASREELENGELRQRGMCSGRCGWIRPGNRDTDNPSPGVWAMDQHSNVMQNASVLQGNVQVPSQATVMLQDPELLLRQAHEAYRQGNYPLALQNCQPVRVPESVHLSVVHLFGWIGICRELKSNRSLALDRGDLLSDEEL